MGFLSRALKTGITAGEFAKLCGVSRTTVYNWEKGIPPHELRMKLVEEIVDALEAAKRSGTLPPKTIIHKSLKVIRANEIARAVQANKHST